MISMSHPISALVKNTEAIGTLYEGLREQAINPTGRSFPANGFGLFIQRGMATWAETQASIFPDSLIKRLKPKASASTVPIFPGKLKTEATQILAEMALNCITELVA